MGNRGMSDRMNECELFFYPDMIAIERKLRRKHNNKKVPKTMILRHVNNLKFNK